MENIILKNGEALPYLKEIPDNSIDLAILDPPWSYNSYGQFPNRNIGYNTRYLMPIWKRHSGR